MQHQYYSAMAVYSLTVTVAATPNAPRESDQKLYKHDEGVLPKTIIRPWVRNCAFAPVPFFKKHVGVLRSPSVRAGLVSPDSRYFLPAPGIKALEWDHSWLR